MTDPAPQPQPQQPQPQTQQPGTGDQRRGRGTGAPASSEDGFGRLFGMMNGDMSALPPAAKEKMDRFMASLDNAANMGPPMGALAGLLKMLFGGFMGGGSPGATSPDPVADFQTRIMTPLLKDVEVTAARAKAENASLPPAELNGKISEALGAKLQENLAAIERSGVTLSAAQKTAIQQQIELFKRDVAENGFDAAKFTKFRQDLNAIQQPQAGPAPVPGATGTQTTPAITAKVISANISYGSAVSIASTDFAKLDKTPQDGFTAYGLEANGHFRPDALGSVRSDALGTNVNLQEVRVDGAVVAYYASGADPNRGVYIQPGDMNPAEIGKFQSRLAVNSEEPVAFTATQDPARQPTAAPPPSGPA